MSDNRGFESVIGLEVHAQLLTQSKMFCSCPNQFGAPENTLICPVCTGQPGSLPVINQMAMELGVRAALALDCELHEESVFARKNYFYPDLPKGYQISQFERPFCTKGHLDILLKSGETRRIGITRIHFEEDAGKLSHGGRGSLVNLNRAGVPLIEIVSEPDLRNSHEAGQYLRQLRSVLRYADICDGNMEEGSFRCDANISVRPIGQKEFGTRVELKNINSFRFVEKAIDFEIARQIDAVERGEKIRQQTRSWNSARSVTEVMRDKEQAHDYRYFPEPDLPTLILPEALRTRIAAEMPELPQTMRRRFVEEYGLSPYDASVLTSEKELARYFEKVQALCKNPKAAANWVMNELLGRLNAAGGSIEQSPVSAEHLAELIGSVESGKISGKIAKSVFEEMFTKSRPPAEIIKEQGLVQISDTRVLEAAIHRVIEANPAQAADYRGGKVKLLGFFVGQVMKETKGQGNPALVNELVKKILG